MSESEVRSYREVVVAIEDLWANQCNSLHGGDADAVRQIKVEERNHSDVAKHGDDQFQRLDVKVTHFRKLQQQQGGRKLGRKQVRKRFDVQLLRQKS